MPTIIIGLIILVIAFIIVKSNSPFRRFAGTLRFAGFALIVAGILLASVYQVEPGEVGVQKLFGKVNDRTLESGLNFINPLVKVVTFDIKTQNYTMSGLLDEGKQTGDDAIRVLSADGLEVIVDLTVLYRIIPS